MAKYIDADIIRDHFNADLSRRPKSFLDDMLMAVVNRVIDNAPAANVVEVVRCKDCRWSVDINGGPVYRCYGFECIEVDADNYCCWGERKDE